MNYDGEWDAPTQVLIVPLWNWNLGLTHWVKTGSNVLIVPLWNWNPVFTVHVTVSLCSNCTFMELKSTNYPFERAAFKSSNCTFMELKWRAWTLSLTSSFVLIVPLWNWNIVEALGLLGSLWVLIVPLWNWNECCVRYLLTYSWF